MSIANSIKGAFLGSFIKKFASSSPKTTFIGILAGALLAAGINWGDLISLKESEVAKLGGAIAVALLGYFAKDHADTPQPQ